MASRPQPQVISSKIFDAIECVNWILLNEKTKTKTRFMLNFKNNNTILTLFL
jgi:hypothetical protein